MPRKIRKLAKKSSQVKAEELNFMPMPEVKGPPVGEELEYRRELQEIILSVTEQFISEHRAEILARADERIKTIKLLSR